MNTTAIEPSPATRLVDRLVAVHGKAGAHEILDAILDKIPIHELAALAYDWTNFWARPKQLLPPGDWRSFGFLTARGVGKTTALANWNEGEVEAGRAMSIGLAAQNEEKTIAVQVAALIDASPPWFKPEWLASAKRLVWPNGAAAYVYTPEVPGAIRGGGPGGRGFDLAWLSEIQSWPAATRQEALLNFQFATRLGYARTVWDATPKKAHPILRAFLARSEKDPANHVVVRGTIYENARNLARGVISDLESEYGGTRAGREELLGEMLADAEAALVAQAWIDDHRRHMPEMIRRAIGVDPAVTARQGSDRTGIVEAGLGVDGQAYVLADKTGKHAAHEWPKIVLDLYIDGACDVVVMETNKGGNLVIPNLRAVAEKRGLRVVEVGRDEHPKHTPGVVYVKEVYAMGPKEDRARPVATAYERGRVSHVIGVDLGTLEETLTTWEPTPGARSPDDLDALTWAITDLLGLVAQRPDLRAGFQGIAQVARKLEDQTSRPTMLSTIFHGPSGGRI